jgi:hypothetical protein
MGGDEDCKRRDRRVFAGRSGIDACFVFGACFGGGALFVLFARLLATI